MTNLEKLKKAANENKSLYEALEKISGTSKEEVVQKVLAVAAEYGLDLEEGDVIVQEELALEELEQVAGGSSQKSSPMGSVRWIPFIL